MLYGIAKNVGDSQELRFIGNSADSSIVGKPCERKSNKFLSD